MTLRHMRIFIAVYEGKSMTVAAKKLFIAQPSVSLAIKELEDYYGVKLFDRISRRLHITEQGKEFYKYASHINSLFDDLEYKINDWDKTGIISIGSSITIGNYLLPGFIKEFNDIYENTKVYITIDNSEEIEKKVISNEVDFGLIENIPHSKHLLMEKFEKDKLVLICGANHPLFNKTEIEIEELLDYDFILRKKGSGSRELFDSTMLTKKIEIKPVGESISNSAIIQHVIAGLGLSVIPYLLVERDVAAGKLYIIEIKDILFARDFYLIYHKNKYISEATQKLMDICRQTHAKPLDKR